jgi:hypothetical protein
VTALVGIYCKNGVVIGADSSATFSNGRTPTIEQPIDKIDIIDEKIIIAGTGEVGLGQRFTRCIETAWNNNQFSISSDIEMGKKLAAVGILDFAATQVKQGSYGALVAIPVKKKPCLYELSSDNFQPELKTERLWYVSMGCGQPITDPFLAFIRDIFWIDGNLPNINEGIFAATWTLDHAVSINPGGINGPVKISVLENENGDCKARLLSDQELDEHRQYISEVKNNLRSFRHGQQPRENTPDIPKP